MNIVVIWPEPHSSPVELREGRLGGGGGGGGGGGVPTGENSRALKLLRGNPASPAKGGDSLDVHRWKIYAAIGL